MTPVRFRPPLPADAAAIHALIGRSPPLDLNTCYAYLLQAHHFADTCIMAEQDGEVVGYVSGYRPPRQPDTLFIWQVVTDRRLRGTGLAATLIAGLLARPACADVRHIETTVSPSNIASARVFRKLSERLQCPLRTAALFTADQFGGNAHEDEILFQIGPFSAADPQPRQEKNHALANL